MSGIFGIFDRSGGPVDLKQLEFLTEFLDYRGPDGRDTFLSDGIGLGHTLLRTTEKLQDDGQPARLGNLSITADVRLDCRDELVQNLTDAGHGEVDTGLSDAVLVLHAYRAWGPKCVDHLRGDFSFGIWNATARALFCARDHFGVKPFYYADLSKVFLFSNTLNCLRQHPLVSDELNEAAIGDFLLFGLNYDKATTTFRDIRRLPPAHWLMVSENKVKTGCYWQPPTEGRIRYPRTHAYIERFNELLTYAVADRLRTDKVGIFLSGGLDSGAIAATAKEISRTSDGVPILTSYTAGYDSLIKDNERVYASKVASYLDIPNKFVPLDDVQLFEKWADAKYRFPEPTDDPMSAGGLRLFEAIAADCRVALYGEGADNLMYFQMWPYIKELRSNHEWGRLLTETAWFLSVRQLPWLGAARRIQSFVAKAAGGAGIPDWIAPEFAKRMRLEERWMECNRLSFPTDRHSARPKAHASLLIPQWTSMFEASDPGVTHETVEVRYPFVDLRLVDYLLAIPVFPWAYKKMLSRKAMKGRLPEEILTRPKTPLSADPTRAQFRSSSKKSITRHLLQGRVCEFVSPTMFVDDCDTMPSEKFRPLCLDFWLKGATKPGGV